MSFERIVLVAQKTRLEQSIRRFNTKSQARFVIEKRGQSFDDYELEDDTYHAAHDRLLHLLPRDLKAQTIDRSFLANFIFTPNDLVVTLGQDGLVVNTAKYLSGQPVLAVNPDPARFDGILLPFQLGDVASALPGVLGGTFPSRNVAMGKVSLNDGQSLYAFNDFFLGANSHISARYTLEFGGQRERQSSSGMIVATPAGSTGWLSSIYNMANGFYRFHGAGAPSSTRGRGPSKTAPVHPGELPAGENLIEQATPDWEEGRLMFVVREPFRSKWSGAAVVTGEITADRTLSVESHMPNKGVIFSDGMETDFLEFNSGATATFSLAEKSTRLIQK